MGDWVTTTIGEFCPFEYGKGLKETDRVQGDVPVYGSNGIVGYHNQAIVESKGVIIGRKGTVGAVHYSDKPFCPIDTTFYVAESSDKDIRFIYFMLKSVGLEQMNSDSAVPGLNRTAAHSRIIEIPTSLEEQRAITEILGALDDKIEVNRHMNVTLESMAQAIFHQWFVESEDVVDWGEKSLYECAGYINGAAYKDFDFSTNNSGLPIIKIAEIKNGITNQTKFTNKQMDEKYRINDGDILFAWSGSPDTSIDTFIWADGEGWLNQHIFKVIPNDPSKKWFTYLLLKSFKEIFIEIARDKQTTGLGHVTVKDLNRLLVAFPPDNILSEFSAIVDPMIEQIFVNLKESRTLGSLRDSLLPKLMRGDVRVKEVDSI